MLPDLDDVYALRSSDFGFLSVACGVSAKLMLFQSGCMNVCTCVVCVVLFQKRTGSILENGVQSGAHL